jgi:hypothetical protein
MNDDDDALLQRLRAAMPTTDHVVHTPDSAHAASLMEQIMQPTDTSMPAHAPTPSGPAAPSRRRAPWLFAGGAVALLAAGAIAVGTFGPTSSNSATGTSLTFQLQATDPLTQSCLPISEIQPTGTELGFGGTVSSIADGTITIDVDRWYRGGPADQVVLDAGSVPNPALDGVEFVLGQRYLVSVSDGIVGGCGTSGPATPEFEQIFAGWFA